MPDQNANFNSDAVLTGSWDAGEKHSRVTRVALQVVVDETSIYAASFDGDAEFRGQWDPPLTESDFDCDPEFTGEWSAPPPGGKDFDCDPVVTGSWAQTKVSQVASFDCDPEFSGLWQEVYDARFDCDPEFTGEWVPAESVVTPECISDAGNITGEKNYVF